MRTLSLYTVYRSPTDYPGWYVVRRHEIIGSECHPRELVARGLTLAYVRDQLPPGLVRLGRDPSDEPQIVESWL